MEQVARRHRVVLVVVGVLAVAVAAGAVALWPRGEVADRLVELALGAPAGLVLDLGGPRTYTMAELARGYLRANGKHRPVLPVRTPGRAARVFRAGANLAPDRAVGHRTWEELLAEPEGRATTGCAWTSPDLDQHRPPLTDPAVLRHRVGP